MLKHQIKLYKSQHGVWDMESPLVHSFRLIPHRLYFHWILQSISKPSSLKKLCISLNLPPNHCLQHPEEMSKQIRKSSKKACWVNVYQKALPCNQYHYLAFLWKSLWEPGDPFRSLGKQPQLSNGACSNLDFTALNKPFQMNYLEAYGNSFHSVILYNRLYTITTIN